MSRVVITNLVPGTEATSTDVNATITSWNDAIDTGTLGANNVRQEGIDRRTLSSNAQAIQAPPAAFVDCIASGSTLTTNATTATYDVVNVGTDLIIGPMTDLSSSSSETVVVRASVWLSAAKATGGAGTEILTELILQSATLVGGPWTDYAQTYQAFQMSNPYADVDPKCVATYTAVLATTPAGSRVYWRLAYKCSDDVDFDSGVIYIEEYAR